MNNDVVPQCNLASNLRQRQQKICLLSTELDKQLNGGLPTGQVTEIYGESGSGKTQICLQLCVNCQLPPKKGGLFGHSVYLYSNYQFPAERLQQITTGMISRIGCEEYLDLGNVTAKKIETCGELVNTISSLHTMCAAAANTCNHIRLVVLDSVTPLIRTMFAHTPKGYRERSNKLFEISQKLHNLAHKFNVAVVIVNEVTDVVGSPPLGMTRPELTSGRLVIPSLGLPWSHCVNNRLFLRRSDNNKRSMKIIFSPNLAQTECNFIIDCHGIL